MATTQSWFLSRAVLVSLVLAAVTAVAFAVLSSALSTSASGGLVTEDVSGALSPANLANDLLGGGIAISNVNYQGDESAAGRFSGGTGIIGFESGVILSTGDIASIAGPNQAPDTSGAFFGPGDSDLDELAGFNTFDAAVLQFDFVPQSNSITFQYVFASEEYNEYVGSDYNDVFAFYVNGDNCALVGGAGGSASVQPVSVNTINNGYFGVTPTNPNLYINNDPFDPDSTGDTVPNANLRNTEMDGLTVVLTCDADVNAGVANHMKLAIADASDAIYDAVVFIRAGSFVSLTATPSASPSATPPAGGSQFTQGDNDCDGDVDAVDALVSLQSNAGFPYSQHQPCWPIGDPVVPSAIPAGVDPHLFGDMDCDGDVDAVDALQILRYVAGLQPNQLPGCIPIGQPL